MSLTPNELAQYLNALVAQNLSLSTMIWGPPGVGKSSVVAQVAAANGLDFVDVRLSQLAPTDLRGLPVAQAGEIARAAAPQPCQNSPSVSAKPMATRATATAPKRTACATVGMAQAARSRTLVSTTTKARANA